MVNGTPTFRPDVVVISGGRIVHLQEWQKDGDTWSMVRDVRVGTGQDLFFISITEPGMAVTTGSGSTIEEAVRRASQDGLADRLAKLLALKNPTQIQIGDVHIRRDEGVRIIHRH